MARTTEATYCRICEAICGLEVDVEDGVVVAVRPDAEHPVSRGYACVKGVRFGEVHRDPDRLRHPMRRGPRGWERVAWDDALGEIGARIARLRDAHGPHAIALYFGNPWAYGYLSPLATQGFVAGLGTRNVFSSGSQDCNNKFVVSKAMFGSSMVHPIPDFARMGFLLVLGANPAVSQMSFVHTPYAMDTLRGIRARGGRVVVLDPRRTETAAQDFAEHFFVRPDTDVFLLAAVAKRIVERGLVKHDVITAHTSGYETLVRALAPIRIEACAQATGVSVETIEDLASALGTADGAAIHVSTGVAQGTSGTLVAYLAHAIEVITGNLDRKGGLLVPEHLVDVARVFAATGIDDSKNVSRVGGFESVLGTLPATILPDEIRTPGEGQIRALISVAGNPALSCANSARMQAALAELDLLVSIDLYRNETAELGHFALPAVDAFQREDFPLHLVTYQIEPYLQFTEAVARTVGEERDEWSIFVDLALASGISFFGVPGLAKLLTYSRKLGANDPLHPRRALDLLLRAGGTSLAALRKSPRGVRRAPPVPGTFLGRRVYTPDRKVALAPTAFVDALRTLDARLAATLAVDRGDTLLLFTKREKTSHNSWLHNVESLVRGRRSTNYAYLHPDDALARGIVAGARVRVHNAWGEIELPARLDVEVMKGAIAIPHGWGHARATSLRVASATGGADVNRLAPDGPDHTERLAGMTQLTGIPVRVERVPAS